MKKQTHRPDLGINSPDKFNPEIMSTENKKSKNKRKKSESNIQNISNSDCDTAVVPIENTQDNRCSENTSKSASKTSEKSHKRFNLEKSQNFDIDADESDNETFRRKSVDIVVDVHCENELSERKTKNKIQSKNNGFSDKGLKSNVNNLKKGGLKKVNSQDNLDLIEEIKDSPKHLEKVIVETSKRSSMEDDTRNNSWMQEDDLPSSGTLGKRRRWKKMEDASNWMDDINKTRRKRWMNESSEEKEPTDYSRSNYLEVKPRPLPRKNSENKMKKNSNMMELNNEAFLPSNEEEVLTIQTNYYKQDTKIEMSLTTLAKADEINYENEELSMIQQMIDEENLSLSDKLSVQSLHFGRPKSGIERKSNFMIDDEDVKSYKGKVRSKSVDELERRSRRKHHKISSQETSVSSLSDDESKWSKRKRSKSRKTKRHRKKHDSKARSKSRSDKESSRRSSSRSEKHTKESNLKTKEIKEKRKKKKKADLVKFISIIIHRSDMLEIDYVTRHPMVKIHIIDSATGEYLDNDGNSSTDISYLQPIITSKFDFKEQKSMIPVWEEEVIFEHDFRDLFRPEPDNVLIIFEIVDLLTFSEAKHNYDKYGSESCWYKIAWAFLKPIGTNGALHINKKLRLQLYRPQKAYKNVDKKKCEAYEWWKSKTIKPYPSSLHVTVSSVEQPKLEPVFYDQLTFNEFSDFKSDSQVQHSKTSESESIPTWTRLPNQACKIPNDILFETEVSENGCFYLAFSNNGKYLAYVASEENNFPIFVYKTEEGRIHVQYNGHKYFVYSLAWSHDDRFLLSVSSDQTARIWDIKEKIIQFIHLLPHPSYVYSGKFDIETSSIVATGCYDNIVRIWTKNKRSKNYELIQELEGHLGFINSMCYLDDNTLLTADSVGIIISWVGKKIGHKSVKKEWKIFRKIKIKEIEGTIINSVFPHPKENNILVQARNNSLLLVNLSTGEISQRFLGLENERIQISSCISPCGNLVLCGGENSTLNIWNLNSGKHLAKYTVHQSNSVLVTCVNYHYFEHMLAFSTFEIPSSVKILKYENHSDGKTVGLTITSEEPVFKMIIPHDSSLRNLGERSMSNSASALDEDVSYQKSTENLLEDSDNQKSLVMKLQKFIETMPIPHFGNSYKMNSIIEKIDRILSNASSSRSADDLESGRIPESSLKLDLKSTTSDFSGETVRMKDFEPIKKNTKSKSRPKSDKSLRNSCYSQKLEDMRNILSEGSLRKNESLDNLVDDEEINFEYNDLGNGFEKSSMNDYKMRRDMKNKDENLDSDGTYVIEKGDVEKNYDLGSSGDSSIKSNITFTIENEVPVPKPRKRLMKQ